MTKITICGSIAFFNEMVALKEELEKRGHEALIPRLDYEVPEMETGGTVYFGKYIEDNGGIDVFPAEHEIWNIKEGAIHNHFKKIEWCDAILVANYEKQGVRGYLGGNTLMEMGVAFFLKKPIYLLHPVCSSLSYKQEVLGMKPVLLNGNIEALKDGVEAKVYT